MAYGSDEPTLEESVDLARSKVFTSALFLIIAGVCNLLVGGAIVLYGISIDRSSDDQLKQTYAETRKMMAQFPQWRDATDQAVKDAGGPVAYYRKTAQQTKRLGYFIIIAAVFCIAGAARMIVVRTYGLAVASSILTMISPMCCCGIGLAIGIWNLVVLFNQDVREGFAANRSLGANGGQPPDDFRRDDYSEDRPGY